MLVTKQALFRKFWYPVLPVTQVSDSPQAFTLLGQNIVVWSDHVGNLAAMENRCCHRSAKLSNGRVYNGCLQCPYHGWLYNLKGEVAYIPQLADRNSSITHKIKAYLIKACYGYAWVCLADVPLCEVPMIEEANSCDFRLIHEFYETWNCAGLRVMENELDLAHPAFVHQDSFGNQNYLVPSESRIEEFNYGLHLYARLGVTNPELQQKNLKMQDDETVRLLKMTWFMPFTCKLDIKYPNGLRHIIVNTLTPISDSQSQMVQFCLRNDKESDVSAESVIAFDRQVTLEDKAILESTDYDVPLNNLREKHLFTDKPGIIMRKQILQLLQANGETEVTRDSINNHKILFA